MAYVGIHEAARALGVHENTIRRRLSKGELTGKQEGQKWLINLPDEVVVSPRQDLDKVRWLEEQLGLALATIREQNGLITRLTERALPSGQESRPWYRRLLWG